MVLLHFFQGFGGETVGGDAFRVGVHHVVYRQSGKGFAFLEQAAQVAVGQDAFQTASLAGNGQHPQPFFAHDDHCVFQRRIFGYGGRVIAAVHQVGHAQQQTLAQPSGGMAEGEVFAGKGACAKQGNGECVAQGHDGGGAGSGGEAERAGFLRNGGGQVDVGMPRHGGFGMGGNADQADVFAF